MDNNLIGTGRTTRMLKEAIRLSGKGYALYVVAADRPHQLTLQSMLDELRPPRGHGIKIEYVEMFPEIDWQTMSMPNARPNCRVLVDHYTIEHRFRYMLQQLHAFDKEE